MKGFKSTGNGPKMGHRFSGKKGFSGSTGKVQHVRGYTRGVPKFAEGGKVGVVRKIIDKTPFKQRPGKPHDEYTSKKTAYYMKSDQPRDEKVMNELVKGGSKNKYALGGRVGQMAGRLAASAVKNPAPRRPAGPIKAPTRSGAAPVKNFVSSAVRGGPGYGSFGRRPMFGK